MSDKALAPSFDEIRGILKELSTSQKEASQQIKELSASQKETDQKIKEVDQQIAENNKGLKKARELFETQWGRLVESLVKGKLLKLLNEREIKVHNLSQRTETSYRREDGYLQQKEFDIIAVNGNEVVVVEVKTTLTPEKVTYFIESLKDFKRYFPYYKDKVIYGAVAYLRSDSEAHLFSQRQGLYVIRATGDSASIINVKSFKPKTFA